MTSSGPKKMSFAEKMMAKMGHQPGQGLGKDGTGIVEPISAHVCAAGSGLGYKEDDSNCAADGWDVITESVVLQITSLPAMTDPLFIKNKLFDEDDKKAIKDIQCPKKNPIGIAWVTFDTESAAAAAMDKYHERRCGPNSRKISTDLVAENTVPKIEGGLESMVLLSNILKAEADKSPEPKAPIKVCDVHISNVAYMATAQDLKELFKGFTTTRVNLKKGFAFVGLKSQDEAEKAIKELNGKKLKGRTVCVSKARGPRRAREVEVVEV